MATDLTYTTGTLLRVLQSIERPVLHFRDRYFRSWHQETGKRIFFDRVSGKPRIAPYVHPRIEGKIVEQRGFQTDSFEPPYVKPKHELDPEQWLKRLPGEAFLGSMSPQQRRDLTVQMILREHEEMVSVREEVQIAEALRTGVVTVVGEGFNGEVNFQRDPDLTVVLTGTDRWSDSTQDGQVLAQIEEWALMVREASGGFIVDEVTMAPDAWQAFLARLTEDQKKMLFDSLRGSSSSVELGPTLPRKAQFKGQIGEFKFFTYDDVYQDEDGNEQHIMPSGSVVLTGAALEGTRCYAAIRDKGAQYQPLRIFPKVYEVQDPSVEYVLSQSAPLMVPFRVNASLGATVL